MLPQHGVEYRVWSFWISFHSSAALGVEVWVCYNLVMQREKSTQHHCSRFSDTPNIKTKHENGWEAIVFPLVWRHAAGSLSFTNLFHSNKASITVLKGVTKSRPNYFCKEMHQGQHKRRANSFVGFPFLTQDWPLITHTKKPREQPFIQLKH